jgi:hypothetical protein
MPDVKVDLVNVCTESISVSDLLQTVLNINFSPASHVDARAVL